MIIYWFALPFDCCATCSTVTLKSIFIITYRFCNCVKIECIIEYLNIPAGLCLILLYLKFNTDVKKICSGSSWFIFILWAFPYVSSNEGHVVWNIICADDNNNNSSRLQYVTYDALLDYIYILIIYVVYTLMLF